MVFIRKYLLRLEVVVFLIPFIMFLVWPQLITNLFNRGISGQKIYNGRSELIWLHAITDAAICASFIGISISLLYLVIRSGKDLPFPRIFVGFGFVITFGGLLYFVGLITIWQGYHWLMGAIKLFLAAASITTAIAFPIIIPKGIQLIKDAKSAVEGRQKLQAANDELEKQVIERKKVEEALKKAHDFLEIRVQERTAQLEKMNMDLTLEINERNKIEEALKESETLFRQLTENIRNVFYVIDPEERKITYVSPAFEEVWGRSRESIYNNYKIWIDSVFDEDKERVIAAVEKQKSTGLFDEQYRIVKMDGDVRWIKVNAFPVHDNNGNIKRITGVAEDITERKNFEQQIEASLKEKDILLKEIHHRVKNNLQIISSLLNLQSKFIKDQKYVEIFRESKNRIKSMALIHEKLYGPRDFTKINFYDYVSELTAYLFNAYSINSKNVKLNLRIDKIFLSMDVAITLGLIINELISNSLKYAFLPGHGGEINIALYNDTDGRYILNVKDNGKGLPEDFDIKNSESLGLQLIQMFVEQLDGKMVLAGEKGLECKINFRD
jgi:PAS domain S-box-containing protein